jgi:hypothetical protein
VPRPASRGAAPFCSGFRYARVAMSRRCLVAACGCWLTATAAAQIPAHATTLNPTTTQWLPTFVQRGDVVHAFGMNSSTILHARSADGGRSWPWREIPLGALAQNTNPNEGLEVVVPVAAHGNALLVLGQDTTLGPRIVRSRDEGLTWGAPSSIAASVLPQSWPMRPRLHADGANVLVVWANHQVTGRVFCKRSTDFGATWQATDTRLDLGFPFFSNLVTRVQVLGAGPLVHVLWDDGSIWRQRSTDGGMTWLPAVADLTGVTGTGLAELVGNGTELLVRRGVTLVRSADAGDTWSVVTSHGVPQVQTLAMQGSLAVVAGRGAGTSTDFFVNASTDGGASWRPVPLQLPSGGAAVVPHAYADDTAVYVHWEVVAFAGNVIRSDDGGATWQVLEGPVHAGFSPGPARTIHAARTFATGGVARYHAYVGVGSSRLGAPTNGTGGIAPRLSTNGLPVRGRATAVHVHGAVGAGLGVIAFSAIAPAAIPFGGGIVHVASTDVLHAFAASGSAGQPGAGSTSLPVAIPADPALVGVRLVAQAIVLDTGVPAGLALTNALELWLR